jgi:glycosyltransferase involved in cell wall biosynthesis
MRIAYRAHPSSPNAMYRAHAPMAALAGLRGHDVIRLFGDDERPIAAPLDGVDVVYVHRYSDPAAQELARYAQDAGAAVLWDNDDDMGAMPRSSVTHRRYGGVAWERRLRDMRRVFAFTDLATAPCEVLARRLADWGAPATDVIENHVPDTALQIRRRTRAETTIGWVAGTEHAIDVQRLPVVAALRQVLEERPDVRVVSIGLGLGLRHERYEHRTGVHLWELSQAVAEFDVGIAPLADVEFNRSRSNVKLKEYAAAGTPWLASPVGPYVELGEKQGGRLVPDDGWHEAIVRLLDRPRERRRLAKRAARWGAAQVLSTQLVASERQLARAVALRRARAALTAPRSAA